MLARSMDGRVHIQDLYIGKIDAVPWVKTRCERLVAMGFAVWHGGSWGVWQGSHLQITQEGQDLLWKQARLGK